MPITTLMLSRVPTMPNMCTVYTSTPRWGMWARRYHVGWVHHYCAEVGGGGPTLMEGTACGHLTGCMHPMGCATGTTPVGLDRPCGT
jgi:hypothetical protein